MIVRDNSLHIFEKLEDENQYTLIIREMKLEKIKSIKNDSMKEMI